MDAVATLPGRTPTESAGRTTDPAGGCPDSRAGDEPAGDRTDTVWPLAHHPTSAGTARRITRDALGAWGFDEDTIDQALLVVSELVTNAVEHALPPITLHLDHATPGNALHIQVDDGGPTTQDGTRTTSRAPDEHGRGHAIIARLAAAHGHRTGPHGTTYWAHL
ncbi:ATP-binding protein [Streptomyces sp. CB03911]|uniref:ATP-binding protein n=1 Tax=Streptomyces sp. CB03911 TaxID=1804758 RepID=UPI0009A11989|nr:ATP-binding protein [Streptomyces sp. CB03911]